jgi:Zn-finger nucleic acid-binding protein
MNGLTISSANNLTFKPTEQILECENCHTIFNMNWIRRIKTKINKDMDVCPICGGVYFSSGKPTKLVIHETHDSSVPYLIEQMRQLKQETLFFQKDTAHLINMLFKNLESYHKINKEDMDKLENNLKNDNKKLNKESLTIAMDFLTANYQDTKDGRVSKF